MRRTLRFLQLNSSLLAATIVCTALLLACTAHAKAVTHITDLQETEPYTTYWFPVVEENLWRIVKVERLSSSSYRLLLKVRPCRASPNELLGWLEVTNASNAHFKQGDYVTTGVLNDKRAIRFATEDELERYHCLA